MVSKTNTTETSLNFIQIARIARQERAIRRAVLHSVENGVTDIPAHGIIHLPFKNYRLFKGTLTRLNKKLEAYDVCVDAYKMNVRGTLKDRIVVTHLDNKAVQPTPAYQTALQSRMMSAA